jgi:hypothetical protein
MFDKYNIKWEKKTPSDEQIEEKSQSLINYLYIYIYINKYKVIRQQVSNYTQIDKRFNCDDDDDN